jgi:hypothetical protein
MERANLAFATQSSDRARVPACRGNAQEQRHGFPGRGDLLLEAAIGPQVPEHKRNGHSPRSARGIAHWPERWVSVGKRRELQPDEKRDRHVGA